MLPDRRTFPPAPSAASLEAARTERVRLLRERKARELEALVEASRRVIRRLRNSDPASAQRAQKLQSELEERADPAIERRGPSARAA